MSARHTWATTRRVLAQLRRDPRTVALLLAVPCALLTLLKYVYADDRAVFQAIGPPLLGIFPLISMFLVTSVAMLRERTSGTLERLMTMPIAKADLLFGYGVAFGMVAVVQALVVGGVGFGLLGLDAAHGVGILLALAVANALAGTTLGLFVSAFARTEFQAVQFLPAFVFPQLLLSGLFAPRGAMAGGLEAVAHLLPLTYTFDALSRASRPAPLSGGLAVDVALIGAVAILSLLLGSVTLRRQTP